MSLSEDAFFVDWSPKHREYIGRCAQFPSLSFLASDPDAARKGITKLVAAVRQDMASFGETPPRGLRKVVADHLNESRSALRWAAPDSSRSDWQVNQIADSVEALSKAVGALAGLVEVTRNKGYAKETVWTVSGDEDDDGG